jgi:hypothetical protein
MRGISERIKSSGNWWIRRTGADGKRHFEKAGTHNAAKTLLNKRRQEFILRKKQPELLGSRAVTFSDVCDDAPKHSGAENSEKQTYELGLRIEQLRPVFGPRSANSIRKNEVVEWLTEQAEKREWAATTRNRWQATFSLIFRVGLDNEKIERNAAARIRKKTEGGGRVRFLSDPEEKRLRAAIGCRFAEFLPHFLLSIHTGMRMSEQYGLRWNQVDFERRQLHLTSDQERRFAHHSSECHRPDLAPGAEGRENPVGNGPRLPFRAHRRFPAGVARMVLNRSRRSEDSRVYLELQPSYLCQ